MKLSRDHSVKTWELWECKFWSYLKQKILPYFFDHAIFDKNERDRRLYADFFLENT